MTLRLKLILSFMLVAAVTAASVVVVFRYTSASEVNSFMLRGTMVGMDELATQLEQYYQANGGWSGVEALLPGGGRGAGGNGMMGGNGMVAGQRLRVADGSGQVVADSRGAPEGSLSVAERLGAIILHDARGNTVGYLLAEGGMGATNSQLLLDRLTRSSLIGALIGAGLALLAAGVLSFQLLKPVGQMTHAAARMAKGDLTQRVEAKSKDELATLGTAFNQMASSLQNAEKNRREMTADIAHELRTPIAVQRAHLEALQDGVYPLTAENLQPVLDQTELLTRLVEDLRTLALADAGELRLERGIVEMSKLASNVLDRFRPEANNRDVELVFEDRLAPGLPGSNLDGGRIEQVLNNLLSNALRHTPGGGKITLNLAQEGGQVVVRVADSGPGIPEEALPHIFERFYRADKARSRLDGGTGLGLAIARQLALAHGGDLTAQNGPQGGAEFTLRLPVR